MPERVLRSSPSTLTFTFYGDGAPVDPNGNVATVDVYKADGTHTITSAPATRVSQGVYTYTLSGQANLNILMVKCSGVFGTDTITVQTQVEIVGGFLFTIAELRAWDTALTDTTKYTSSRIVEVRDQVEEEFERYCHRAFVPRYHRDLLAGDGTVNLCLDRPEPFTILSLTVDGIDVLSTAVTSIDKGLPCYLIRRDGPWPRSQNLYDPYNIVIEYEYGALSPPFAIIEAAKKRARSRLVQSQSRIDERATVMQVDGFGQFNLSTPGLRGALTGIPEVDKALNDADLYGGMGGIH